MGTLAQVPLGEFNSTVTYGVGKNLRLPQDEVSDPKGETVTCGSPYKFTRLNSPEISHPGKTLISPNL